MTIIKRHLETNGRQYLEHQAQLALAGALVHDLGHGMFSHAFEDVGKKLNIRMARHEQVSDALIRDSEISEAFRELGKSFSEEVADLIKQSGPGNIYDAVVSSQFDADRLDYMQRDRLMTGVQSSGIDFTWLLANLEVGTLSTGVDEEPLGEIETFVLAPKALRTAEALILALFQLYPNVYFHKATRGAEKVFTALMLKLIALVRSESTKATGLPDTHPIVKFAREPEDLGNVCNLDDAVFLGALPLLMNAEDICVKRLSTILRNRELPKCCDIREHLIAEIAPKRPTTNEQRNELKVRLEELEIAIEAQLNHWSDEKSTTVPRLLIDRTEREPYKTFQESKGPLNQIRIRDMSGHILDMAEKSPIVAAIETFKLFRVYFADGDQDAKLAIERITNDVLKGGGHGTK